MYVTIAWDIWFVQRGEYPNIEYWSKENDWTEDANRIKGFSSRKDAFAEMKSIQD